MSELFKFATIFTVCAMLFGVSAVIVNGGTSSKKVERTRLVHMCRENHTTQYMLVEHMSRIGWEYRGITYNDGINCSVSLWVCRAGPCVEEKDDTVPPLP